MDPKHLEENLVALLTDVNSVRPKRAGKFVTKVLLTSPPSGEVLKIDPFVYIPEERIAASTSKDDEGDVEEESKSEATN